MDFKTILTNEIAAAARKILLDLFANGEHYYYITLATDGLAGTPCISAWSKEALAVEYKKDAENAEMIKWSYADSPYCCWKQECFQGVSDLLRDRKTNDENFEEEYEMRFSAMENAMKLLDEEGLFERNQDRDQVMVLVEVMPPDFTNTKRAYRMNDSSMLIFRQWLAEAAEEVI
ncbi:MAG: DUF4303 domain-containing protein [Lachnospiraceae bacterium]|nr:DUF4303 domain-containing protein [Lachnospiraceae bacterium]